MKKVKTIIVSAALAIVTACSLCACGSSNGNFDYAYINLPNGTCKEGNIKGYTNLNDMQEVVFDDGTIIRTGAENIVLVSNNK